ncbi:MAG: hypothetical protein JWM68_4420 [Verrucomicrobiales bacterium]|nr:hypothetical protein [Verrucomicrobiales bacterium]
MSARFLNTFVKRVFFYLFLLACTSALRAQWLSQSVTLSPGWNAVYFHVDSSHTTLNAQVGADVNNPILEVWRWNPGATIQFTTDPQNPIDSGSQWISWNRSSANSPLQRIVGNSAYLVRVGTNVSSYTWTIKGKPMAPANDWTSTGLNFIGFQTVPVNPPSFDTFLAASPDLQQAAEIYYYRGGELGSNNPARLLGLRNTLVNRGQAYWVRAGTVFNHYFAPFSVNLQTGSGIDFQNTGSSSTFRLKNYTTGYLTVSASLIASETPPSGQTNISGVPPLIIRGAANQTNVVYSYTNLPLNGSRSWILAPNGQPGSELDVVLGLNRTAITAAPGSYLAGILRFTDSLGFSQEDVPVTAIANSTAGLWVGRALVTQVGQYLKTFQRDAQNSPVVSSNGQYIVTGTDTSLGAASRPFPLRLIVHNPSVGTNAVLLAQVFYGPDAFTNMVVATKQSALNQSMLDKSRRITATHLPCTANNTFWGLSGRLGTSSTLSTTVNLDYNDQASNPFLHTYHPDHDNLDATFKTVLPQGSESYSVRRAVTLNVNPAGNDFASQIAGTQKIEGEYLETITVLGLPRAGNTNDTRQFQVRGVFSLNRISDIPALTVVP